MVAFELDVFVGNVFIIDWQIFELWLSGLECESAVEQLQRAETPTTTEIIDGSSVQPSGKYVENIDGVTIDMLHSDVQQQYGGLAMLQRLLDTPAQLTQQCCLQISSDDRCLALQRYYDLDDCVVRELVGKKPSSKQRKELDDVAERTGVLIRSCRRQFDNIRRIYKACDDMPGDVMDNIQRQFLLPARLVRRYAVVLFLSWVRIEVHKRKIAHLSFQDLFVCGDALLRHWADSQAELDREFLLQLRELKILLDCDKEAKAIVLSQLSGSVSTDCRGDLQQNFRLLFRCIVGIAVSLHHSRDLKSLFIDIHEKVVEPCRAARWNIEDMRQFTCALDFSPDQLHPFRRDEELHCLWQRFWRAASVCIGQLFNS